MLYFDFVFLFKIWLGRRQAFWESLLLRWDHPDFYSPCGQVHTASTLPLQYYIFYKDTWTNAQILKKNEAIIITMKSCFYHCAELLQQEHAIEFISAKGTSIILRCWRHKNPFIFCFISKWINVGFFLSCSETSHFCLKTILNITPKGQHLALTSNQLINQIFYDLQGIEMRINKTFFSFQKEYKGL